MRIKLLFVVPFLLACAITEPVAQIAAQASPTSAPTPAPSAAPLTCTVTADALHVRAAPHVSARALAYLHAGDVLTVLTGSPVDNWIQIQTGDLTGWINSTYCKGSTS